METSNVLDVTTLPPPVRHPTIFEKLDALATGETLRLLVDHDPVPLRYQLDATRPGQFRWEMTEDGPVQWVVDITSIARVLDVRPILDAGGEPFDTIMSAVDELGDDEVLVIHASFEPVPLEGVLGEQGFDHVAEELAEDHWRVTFTRR